MTKQELLTEQAKRNAELDRKYDDACLLRRDHEEARALRQAARDTFKDAMEDNSNESAWELHALQRELTLAAEAVLRDDDVIARLEARRELGRVAYDIAHRCCDCELTNQFRSLRTSGNRPGKADRFNYGGLLRHRRLTQNFGSDIVNGLSQVRLMLEGLIISIGAELNPAPAPKLLFGHTTVRFLKATLAEGKFSSIGCYSKGDEASFESEVAHKLVAGGIAEWA